MEKRKLTMNYSVEINIHAIARLIGSRRAINRSPVNFYLARLHGWAGRVTITHTCSDAPILPYLCTK